MTTKTALEWLRTRPVAEPHLVCALRKHADCANDNGWPEPCRDVETGSGGRGRKTSLQPEGNGR